MAKAIPQRLTRSDHTPALLVRGAGQAADVIELIMADHRRIRRLGQALDDAVRRSDRYSADWMLSQFWQRLAGLLEAHARAEEEICYLSMFGPGAHAAERRREAIADHDDIREAIGEASLQRTGSALWWRASGDALTVAAEHMEREERGVLADCLPRLTLTRRRELGRQWSAFLAAWTRDAAAQSGADRAVGQASGLPRPGRHRRVARE